MQYKIHLLIILTVTILGCTGPQELPVNTGSSSTPGPEPIGTAQVERQPESVQQTVRTPSRFSSPTRFSPREIPRVINAGDIEKELFRTMTSSKFELFTDPDILDLSFRNHVLESYGTLVAEEKEANKILSMKRYREMRYSFLDMANKEDEVEVFHMGVEIEYEPDAGIPAAGAGVVVCIGTVPASLGHYVIVKHDFDYFEGFSIIAGLSNVRVRMNEKVDCETRLGSVKNDDIFFAVFDMTRCYVDPIEYTYFRRIDRDIRPMNRGRTYRDQAEKISSTVSPVFCWPINPPIRITSPYGYRQSPFNRKRTVFHSGLDMANNMTKAPILSIADGVVTSVCHNHPIRGNSVIVKHDGGYISRYHHLSSIEVTRGQSISAGSKLGSMGSTGRSTGPHLHLTIIKDGRAIDPQTVLTSSSPVVAGR